MGWGSSWKGKGRSKGKKGKRSSGKGKNKSAGKGKGNEQDPSSPIVDDTGTGGREAASESGIIRENHGSNAGTGPDDESRRNYRGRRDWLLPRKHFFVSRVFSLMKLHRLKLRGYPWH